VQVNPLPQPHVLQRPRQPSNVNQPVGRDEIPPFLLPSACVLPHLRGAEVPPHLQHFHAMEGEIGLHHGEDVLLSERGSARGNEKGRENARGKGIRLSRSVLPGSWVSCLEVGTSMVCTSRSANSCPSLRQLPFQTVDMDAQLRDREDLPLRRPHVLVGDHHQIMDRIKALLGVVGGTRD